MRPQDEINLEKDIYQRKSEQKPKILIWQKTKLQNRKCSNTLCAAFDNWLFLDTVERQTWIVTNTNEKNKKGKLYLFITTFYPIPKVENDVLVEKKIQKHLLRHIVHNLKTQGSVKEVLNDWNL